MLRIFAGTKLEGLFFHVNREFTFSLHCGSTAGHGNLKQITRTTISTYTPRWSRKARIFSKRTNKTFLGHVDCVDLKDMKLSPALQTEHKPQEAPHTGEHTTAGLRQLY